MEAPRGPVARHALIPYVCKGPGRHGLDQHGRSREHRMLRTPRNLSTQPYIQTGSSVLDAEILDEKASALGRAGHNVEVALRKLNDLEKSAPERPTAVNSAARAVYHYFIQRELCGFRNHAGPIRQYGIPREVLVRLGAG